MSSVAYELLHSTGGEEVEPKKRTRADTKACFEERESWKWQWSTLNTAAGKVMVCFEGLPNSSHSSAFLSECS